MSLPAPILPDVLEPGLRVVFCGTAPGTASARAGAYYAGPGNRFWTTLHEVGLTPVLARARRIRPPARVRHRPHRRQQDGFGSDREVGRRGFDPWRLPQAIAAVGPATSPSTARTRRGPRSAARSTTAAGPERIGGATVWVLPSTSGAARRFWDIGPWRDLADAARRPLT